MKQGGVPKLYEIMVYALDAFNNVSELKSHGGQLLIYCCKALTSICNIDTGVTAVLELCPGFASHLCSVIALDRVLPLATENAIESCSRLCSNESMQRQLIGAGIIWQLIPMLLGYDQTVQDDYSGLGNVSAIEYSQSLTIILYL